MFVDADTELYGIFGNPIKHSLSPLLHNKMFEQYSINAVYTAFQVSDLENAVRGIKALGIKGINVTIPHKKDVIKFLDYIDDDAKNLNAVNTIKNIDSKLYGYNTDYLGFMDTFKENIPDYFNKTITVLGAGGATRGVIYALHKLGIEKINIINRSVENAYNLKYDFKNMIDIDAFDIKSSKEILNKSEIVINCTSVGLNDNESPVNVNHIDNAVVMDIIYKDTKFIELSKLKGLKTVNGMSMFINQAFYSFKIWKNIEFDKNLAFEILKEGQ